MPAIVALRRALARAPRPARRASPARADAVGALSFAGGRRGRRPRGARRSGRATVPVPGGAPSSAATTLVASRADARRGENDDPPGDRDERRTGRAGPYSQAIAAGGFVFCAGQLGLDPTSGELPDGIEAQAERALANSGRPRRRRLRWGDVVKTTIFLADIGDFAAVNGIYGRFSSTRRRPVHVRRRALPKGGLVEVEAIARRR